MNAELEKMVGELIEAAHAEGYNLALQTHPMQPHSDRTAAAKAALLARIDGVTEGRRQTFCDQTPTPEK